ncbi:MAG: hypothetical protein WCP69_11415 [Bacteroidota bacterium]
MTKEQLMKEYGEKYKKFKPKQKINTTLYYIGLSYSIVCSILALLIDVYYKVNIYEFKSYYVISFIVLISIAFINKHRIVSGILLIISLLTIFDMTWNYQSNFIYNMYNYNFHLSGVLFFIGCKNSILNTPIGYFMFLLFFQIILLYIGVLYLVRDKR